MTRLTRMTRMTKTGRTARVLLTATAGALALSGTALVGQAGAAGTTYTHAEATKRLKAAGISWTSSKGCSDKNGKGCTSFTGIRKTTIDGVIGLKRASRCSIVITGAAEKYPHSTKGRYTHEKGYKVDVRTTTCVTNHIKSHAKKGKTRGDGAPQWTAPGVVYAKESSHWDITYTG